MYDCEPIWDEMSTLLAISRIKNEFFTVFYAELIPYCDQFSDSEEVLNGLFSIIKDYK